MLPADATVSGEQEGDNDDAGAITTKPSHDNSTTNGATEEILGADDTVDSKSGEESPQNREEVGDEVAAREDDLGEDGRVLVGEGERKEDEPKPGPKKKKKKKKENEGAKK